MRTYIIFLTIVLSIQNQLVAQVSDLKKELYSDFTLARLQYISDSLHARYKAVPTSKNNWSHPQTQGNWIFLDSMVQDAHAFLKTNPSFETFLKKFPFAKTEKNLLVQEAESTQLGSPYFRIRVYPDHYPYNFDHSFSNNSLKNKWLDTILTAHIYRPKDELVACFFENDFKKQVLPDKYASYIQYTDFIADTNTSIFLSDIRYRDKVKMLSLPVRKSFYQLLFPKQYDPQDGDFDAVIDLLGRFRINNLLEKYLSETADFKNQLAAACEEALIKKVPAAGLEYLALKYISPAKALQIKRLRRISSNCGNDDRPRWHRFGIAKLAAQQGHWQLFMRTYLSLVADPLDAERTIENHRFYTEQLELLHIKVRDLYLGGILRIHNGAANHWTIVEGGLGNQVLGYYKEYPLFEKELLNAVADKQLDDYNRYVCWKIYEHIIKSRIWKAQSDSEKKAFRQQWNQSKVLLPNYIASGIHLN